MTHEQQNCPVTGEKIDKRHHTDYDSKRIYFCSHGCIDAFYQNPEKYMTLLKDQGVILETAGEPSPHSFIH